MQSQIKVSCSQPAHNWQTSLQTPEQFSQRSSRFPATATWIHLLWPCNEDHRQSHADDSYHKPASSTAHITTVSLYL